jgi:signal transduction histidine kinase
MNRPRWWPASLVRRYALATAGLAAAALLLTSLGSWWLIRQQHENAIEQLAQRERQHRAEAVGNDLRALAARMAEVSASTILATGLVDSAGRETYLAPFLNGIRQINGIPVQLTFTDYRGTEIASNDTSSFTPEQLAWLRAHLQDAQPAATIFSSPKGDELVAVEPMLYARTSSPEGAVLYKVGLRDLDSGPSVQLEWGPREDETTIDTSPVPVPAVFQHLNFRVKARDGSLAHAASPELPYFHILLVTIGLFTVIVIAGLNLARVLTRDLRQLEAFATRLFEGDLGTERAPEGSSAEVDAVARALNGMLDRINLQHITLLGEQGKLTRLTGELQAADRRKDDFLAMLGHELRNPLAPISAGAQLLAKLPGTDPRIVRTSQVISRQVGQMTKIVNDLLDVSRVNRGLITLERVPLDASEVVAAAAEQVKPLIESRGHTLTIMPPTEPVRVIGDHARLVQVLSNLLTNAAKYTPNGGHIVVRLACTAAEALLEVADDGMGITPELMPEIFELFTQGSRGADRVQGGLGLGLALVKNLVELHGGAVRADSPGEGRGATFTVRLPRASDMPLSAHALPAPHLAKVQPRRILVVDDNADAARTLADWLKLEGHTVYVFFDGPSALDFAAPDHIDAFVLDIGLPGMDGREVARRLRARPDTKESLLIALSGYGQAVDLERSAAAGFDHHLVKPADPEALQHLLAQA